MRWLLACLLVLSASVPFALLTRPAEFDLVYAISACSYYCSPDPGVWRYDGRALTCACDDLSLGTEPSTPRRKR